MTSEHLRAQRSPAHPAEPEPAQPETAHSDAAQPETALSDAAQSAPAQSESAEPDAVQPRPAGAGTRRVLAPQAPAALGGMGSTGPITLVQKKR